MHFTDAHSARTVTPQGLPVLDASHAHCSPLHHGCSNFSQEIATTRGLDRAQEFWKPHNSKPVGAGEAAVTGPGTPP